MPPSETSELPTVPNGYEELVASYRKMKHDVNNSLAVMMAMAEMAQRRADFVPKLIDLVLDKAQKTADDMRAFQEQMNALLPPGSK